MTYQPLTGVRVLDLGRLLPSALAARRLQALGADVVKVEDSARPDWIRDLDPMWAGRSCQDEAVNSGKRSVAVPMRTPDGLATVLALIGAADVVLENSLPGQLLRLGIDFAELRRQRPTLVVCSITGYGQTGPLSSTMSHGLNMEAMAGALPVAFNDGLPARAYTFTSMAVEIGAAHAATAVAAALFAVRGGAPGAWIDISCWDAAVEAHRSEIVMTEASGEVYRRAGRGAFYEVYRCADDRLVLLGAVEQKFWAAFCAGVDRPDLVGEWAGEGALDFGEDRPELKRTLAEIFATAPAAEWMRRFQDWGVAGSEVLDIADIMAHPHYAARGFVTSTGSFPDVAAPIRWHDDPDGGAWARPGPGPAPGCGQQTAEVLQEWLG